jgi:signal transduction histidine kinase
LNTDLSVYDVGLVIVVGTIIVVLLSYFIILFVLTYKKKQREHISEVNKIQSEFSQTLLQSQLEIKEQTLQQIAYELHDNLGQIASLIKINLNTLQLDDLVKSTQKIEDTKELVRQLITDLKSLSLDLNSERAVQLGIVKGLETEVDRLNKTGQFDATLLQEGSTPELDANTTIILYRMSQEIINNIVKHSGAKVIGISLTVTEKLFTLAISDDGVGFDLEDKFKGGGSGLLNLQNRAKLIRATFSLQSSIGSGTKINIELPL